MNKINFRPISTNDFELIHKWLNEEHVRSYQKTFISLGEVKNKYLPRIWNNSICHVYIASFEWTDFWLIQYYKNIDYPKYAEEIWVTKWVSVDLLIWNKDFLWKCFWRIILKEFIKKIFEENKDIDEVFISHEIANDKAIKCSLSVWWKLIKEFYDNWEKSKLFVFSKNKKW